MSKVSSLVDCSNLEEVECLNDFVESIQNEMSVNGSIPFTIPAESIAQLTKNAKTMFYKMYEDATEEMFIAIPESEIRKHSFNRGIHSMDKPGDKKVIEKFKPGETKEDKNTGHTRGTYLLPDGVISVVGVYSLGGWGTLVFSERTPVMSVSTGWYISQSMTGPWRSLLTTLCITFVQRHSWMCQDRYSRI